MSFSDTQLAKRYASIAEVAAAQAKIYAQELEEAPNYAAEAAESAEAAANSSSSASQYAGNAAEAATSASSSASDAASSAASAASAAQGAINQTIRAPQGEILSQLPSAASRQNQYIATDSAGNVTIVPRSSIPVLDSGGKLPVSTIPAIALTEPFVVSSQAAMLALDAQPGDIAKRTDKGYSFCLAALPASTLSNWIQLNDDVLAQLALTSGAMAVGATSLTGESSTVQAELSKKPNSTDLSSSSGAASIGALDDSSSATTIQGALNLKLATANIVGTGSSQGAKIVGIKSPLAGAIARTQHDKNLETVSIKDFGAIGDGVNHPLSERFSTLTVAQMVYPFVTSLSQSIDWAATQAACNASNAVIAPSGVYYISGNVTKSAAPIFFQGAGVGVTIFVCAASSGDIFKHIPTAGDHFFDISNFTIIPTAAETSGVTAIHVDGSSQVTTAPYKGMFLTGEREKRRGRIHNINIFSNDSVSGPARGIRVTSLLNYSIHDICFVGPSGSYSYDAFCIDGDGACTDITVYNLWAYNVTRAFNMPDYVEGLFIDNVNFINVVEGICGYYQSSYSVLSTTAVPERSNALKIGKLHINFSGTAGIRLTGSPYTKISEQLIIAADVSRSQKSFIEISGNYVEITNISCVGDATLASGSLFGVLGDSLTNSTIRGVQVKGGSHAVLLTDGSVSNIIDKNIAYDYSNAVGVTIQGSTSVDNVLTGNRGVLYDVVTASTENYLEARNYNSVKTITLAAGSAGGTVETSVTIPARTFKSAPTFAAMTGLSGTGLIFEYKPSTSTATTLVFVARLASGGAISAGSYSVVLNASMNVG